MTRISGTPYPSGVKFNWIQGKVSPPGVKSQPNLGHEIPTRVKSQLDLGQHLPHQGMMIWTPKPSLHTWQNSKRKLGEGFATRAKVQMESRTYFCIPCNGLPRIRARFCTPCIDLNRISGSQILTAIYHLPDFLCLTDGSSDRWQMAISFSLFFPVFLFSFEIIC